MSRIPVASSLDESWINPPAGQSGELLQVGFRIGWERVAQVSTVNGTVWINIAITLYWTDPRLVGWKGTLPPLLWGPAFSLVNKAGSDMNVYDEVFALTDPTQGRLKRGIVYQGTIVNPMELSNFPFDIDDILVHLHTSSHWRCLDSSHENMLTFGKAYDVYPITDAREGATSRDPFCRLENPESSQIPEWALVGYSYEIEREQQVTGIESTEVFFKLLVKRKSMYYVFKVMAPLYLTTSFQFVVFVFPPEALEVKINITITLLLTTMAFQYVIASDLPKVDFLTMVDKALGLSLMLSFLCAATAVDAHLFNRAWGQDLVGAALFSCWVIATLVLIVPALLRKHRDLAAWAAQPSFRTFVSGKQ